MRRFRRSLETSTDLAGQLLRHHQLDDLVLVGLVTLALELLVHPRGTVGATALGRDTLDLWAQRPVSSVADALLSLEPLIQTVARHAAHAAQ